MGAPLLTAVTPPPEQSLAQRTRGRMKGAHRSGGSLRVAWRAGSALHPPGALCDHPEAGSLTNHDVHGQLGQQGPDGGEGL